MWKAMTKSQEKTQRKAKMPKLGLTRAFGPLDVDYVWLSENYKQLLQDLRGQLGKSNIDETQIILEEKSQMSKNRLRRYQKMDKQARKQWLLNLYEKLCNQARSEIQQLEEQRTAE